MNWILRLCEQVAGHWNHAVIPQNVVPDLKAQLNECQAYGARTLGKLIDTCEELVQARARATELENIPPLVPDEQVEAAKEYANYMDNCMISPEEKRRACIARLSEQFPGTRKSDLALALEVGLKCLR